MGLFNWFKKTKDKVLKLRTAKVSIEKPTYKQVVEHIKAVHSGGEFIELLYKNEQGEDTYLVATPDGDNFFAIEYQKVDPKEKYKLGGVDVESTMCFFRDFTEVQKIIDYDFENNEFIKTD